MRRPTQPEIVEAEQVGPGAQAHPQGTRPSRPGEWVVTNHATAQTQTLSNDEFVRDYVPLAMPAHILAPQPGTGPEFEPQYPYAGQPAPQAQGTEGYLQGDWQPQAEQPAPPQSPGLGDQELSTPMNEGLPGRPAPTVEARPRLEEGAPIETNTGQPPGSPNTEPVPPERMPMGSRSNPGPMSPETSPEETSAEEEPGPPDEV